MNRCVCEREIHFGVGNKWYHTDSSESCINYAPPPTESILDPNLKALHEEPPYRNAKVLDLEYPANSNLLIEECADGGAWMTYRGQEQRMAFKFSKAQWKALQSIVYQL